MATHCGLVFPWGASVNDGVNPAESTFYYITPGWHQFFLDWHGVSFWLWLWSIPQGPLVCWFLGSSSATEVHCLQEVLPGCNHGSCLGALVVQEACPIPFRQRCCCSCVEFQDFYSTLLDMITAQPASRSCSSSTWR